MAFNKYGVVFSYLDSFEKKELIQTLTSQLDAQKERIAEKLSIKERLKNHLLYSLSLPSAVNMLAKDIGLSLTYCPYEQDDERNLASFEDMVKSISLEDAENLLSSVQENL
jgi:hypothetical protein